MSSKTVLGAPHDEAHRAQAKPAALYVCPGAKDVPIDYAIFPYGSGFTGLCACPGRDICMWYAAHDLGGEVEFNELPEESMLPGIFNAAPFRCDDFCYHEKATTACLPASKRPRNQRKQHHPAPDSDASTTVVASTAGRR
jgi:hypothetical protein